MVLLLAAVAVQPEPAPAWLLRFAPGRADEAPAEGGVSQVPPCPLGQGVRGSGSLGKGSSITSTHITSPLEIAKQALSDFDSLPYNHHLNDSRKLCEDFVEYLDLTDQKGFTVKGYDTKKGKIVKCPLSYENRWSLGRRERLSRKLDNLEYWFELQVDRPVTMITLTCFHEGLSIGDAWHALNISRIKLLKLIAKYFDSPDYIWVVEPHKSGYVHYHLAVFDDVSNEKKDSRGKGIEDKFRDLWSRKYKTGSHTYGLDFSQKDGEQKIKGLKDYLTKYLRKGFLLGDWSPAILTFNAHLWDTGHRLYGASAEIRKVMNISEDESNKDIVWLETKINDVRIIEQQDGYKEIYGEDRVIWYRQYIPDWLDSSFWLQDRDNNRLRLYDPDKLYFCDWGRPVRDITKGYDPTFGQVTNYKAIHSDK